MTTMRHDFVNTEAIDKTIASIKRGPFDMGTWDTCICGHAVRAAGRRLSVGRRVLAALEGWGMEGSKILGLDEEQAFRLFCDQRYMDATKAEAIAVLKILRDEGVVDWRRAKGGKVSLDDAEAEFERWAYEVRLPRARLRYYLAEAPAA